VGFVNVVELMGLRFLWRDR